MTVLVTGAGGFIGFHLSKRLLDRGTPVIGIDSLNDYYSPQLKRDRLAHLEREAGVSQLVLHRLERTDGSAELFPFPGI